MIAEVKVVALCGGIGGAKLALGLHRVLGDHELTVVCNTGDDIDLFGLHISPDVDIVMYTLAGLVDTEKGWGIADDTFRFLEALGRFYRQDRWFSLGDQDLATHVLRTSRLREGKKLSEVTSELCEYVGLNDVQLIPMTDDSVRTHVRLGTGSLVHFEEFFVRMRCEAEIKEVMYVGADTASPADGVLDAISSADLVVVCPSNPIASIGPILSVKQIASALEDVKCPVVAVSPLVGGEAIKGPTVKFMKSLGLEATAFGVAHHYRRFLSHYVLDAQDRALEAQIEGLGLKTVVTNTIMKTLEDKMDLARIVLSIHGR